MSTETMLWRRMTMDKYPILDETGHARTWLDTGRGVNIWESQEIGRPDILTPGDGTKPHWAYKLKRQVTSLDEVTFFLPVGIVQSWKDSPQGWRAASRALETKYPDKTWDSPAGRFATTYTLCSYTMGSIQIRADKGGTTLRYRNPNEEHPTLLDVEFRVGVLRWNAAL